MKLSERKKIQILHAAELEFRAHGLAGTNMDKIAAVAEVSKRTVYNHFSSKDELFRTIIFGMLEKIDSAADLSFDENSSIRDQLRQIANNEVDLLTSDSFIGLARVTYMEMLNDQAFSSEIAKQMGACERLFANWIQSACDLGYLKVSDPTYASQQFIYQLKSFLFYPVLYGLEVISQEKTELIIERTIDMFMAQYQVR